MKRQITFILVVAAIFGAGVTFGVHFTRTAQAHPCEQETLGDCRFVERTDSAGGKFMVYVCD